MKRISGIALAVVSVVYLSGCAAPARVDNMSVDGQPAQRVLASPMRNSLSIKDVTGGQETNPLWKSNVGSAEFERALEESLRTVGLLAPTKDGKYFLTAHLEGVDQPFAGFNMTVTATVRYVITEKATGKDVFSKSIVSPYTAKMGDAFLGTERLRLANEGAVRENISKLIDALFALEIKSISVN